MFKGVVYAWKQHEVPTGATRVDVALAPGKPVFHRDCPYSYRLEFSSAYDFLSALHQLGISYSIPVFCVMACYLCGFDVTAPYPSRGHNGRIIYPFMLSKRHNRFIANCTSSYVIQTNFIHKPIFLDLLTLHSALRPWEAHRLTEESGRFYFVAYPYVCSDCVACKRYHRKHYDSVAREYELLSL